MSSPRRRAREAALQFLYRYELDHLAAQTGPSDAVDSLESAGGPPPASVLVDELRKHFEHFAVAPESREFAAELVAGTLRERETLDALIEKHASNWKLPRMSAIDRNLLRMAAFELTRNLATGDVPASVTLDEAIELSKQFGTQDSPAFVNGVLDAILTEASRQKAP